MSMMCRCFVPALVIWQSAASSGTDAVFNGVVARRMGGAVASTAAVSAEITATCTKECNFNWTVAHTKAEKTTVCMVGCEKSEQCKEAKHKEEEELCTKNSGNASFVILGGVAFIMAIFYLVNSREKLVADQSWSLISTSISIFVAVMLFALVNGLLKVVFGLDGEMTCEAPGGNYMFLAVCQLIGWWLVVVGVLACHCGSVLRLKAYGIVGGHILGFSAIHVYGYLAITPTFNTSHWMTLVVILVYFVSMPVIVAPTRLVGVILRRLKFTHVEELHEQAKDTAADFFAMGLSFLICMFFRGLITGKVPSIHASHHNHPHWQVGVLLLVGVVFAFLAGASHVAHHKARSDSAKEACDYLSTTFALTSAWCQLDGVGWHFLHYIHSPVQSKAAVAMIFSVVFVVSVFVMWFLIHRMGLKKRLLRGIFTAIALTVGLSWEHTFDAALEGVGCVAKNNERAPSEKLFVVLLEIIFAVVVTPAWVVYILPKHDEDLMKDPYYQTVRLPLSAVCCDLDDEEYEYEMTQEDVAQGVQFVPTVMMAPQQYMQPTSFANVQSMQAPYMQPMPMQTQYMQPPSQYSY